MPSTPLGGRIDQNSFMFERVRTTPPRVAVNMS
jgi:hypothetical protein